MKFRGGAGKEMAMYPEELRYTDEHEWIRLESDRGVVGLTDYAQREMGDIVYVEMPEVGRKLKAGEPFGVVESVKSVSDMFAPMTGTVAEVNGKLEDAPELINQDPYGKGWIIVVDVSEPEEVAGLLTAAQYRALVE